jgi:pseudouridine synthase
VRERLQKILSSAGIASRRAAEKLMEEGRVEVDGRVVRELGTSADPETQEIRVDGTRVRPGKPRRTVALNKPKGYVTTRSDPGRRPTVMELLPPAFRGLYPVGRLDMGSTGLLILTDDGELAQRLTHPRFGIEKSYLVTLAGQPDKKTLDRATRGIVVEGERLSLEEVELLGGRLRQASASLAEARRAKAGRPDRRSPSVTTTGERSERTRLRATLRRGKNREIRRLFEALGFPVIDLHRERIGGLSVRGIPLGGFRPLSRAEVKLLEAKSRKPRAASGASPAGRKRMRRRRDARESGRPPRARSEGSERGGAFSSSEGRAQRVPKREALGVGPQRTK